MSYSIATALKYKDGKIYGKAGCNNVRPFYSTEFEYDDKELFLKDILSGGLDLGRLNTKFAEKVKRAREDVKDLHQAKYGELQNNYMYGSRSINPFSLYMIGNVYFTDKRGDKDKFLDNTKDLEGVGKSFHTEKMVEYAIYSTKWEEFVRFYKFLLTDFFNKIK